MTIGLDGKEKFCRVEALDEGVPRSVLVLGKQPSEAMLVSFSDFEKTKEVKLEIPGKLENRQMLDVCIWENKAAILYDKNAISVFELTTGTVLFKATYAEATDNISRILFISDQVTNTRSEHPDLLGGFFLLVETKPKPVKKENPFNIIHHLRKLHLVEIQQTETQVKKSIQRLDKLEQIDTLTIAEETPNEKLIDF